MKKAGKIAAYIRPLTDSSAQRRREQPNLDRPKQGEVDPHHSLAPPEGRPDANRAAARGPERPVARVGCRSLAHRGGSVRQFAAGRTQRRCVRRSSCRKAYQEPYRLEEVCR